MGAIETQNGVAAQSKINAFTKVSSDYTLTSNDRFLAVNCTNGSVTIRLPTAFIPDASDMSQIFVPSYGIKKVDKTLNPVNILTSNSETIDGENSFILDNSQESINLISDGNNWLVY